MKVFRIERNTNTGEVFGINELFDALTKNRDVRCWEGRMSFVDKTKIDHCNPTGSFETFSVTVPEDIIYVASPNEAEIA